MSNAKYQPLRNNDDDDDETLKEEDFNNNDHNQILSYKNKQYCYQECKIYWLLLLCFIIIKTLYALNNYDTIMRWLAKQNNNETDRDILINITNRLSNQEITVNTSSQIDIISVTTKNKESKINIPSVITNKTTTDAFKIINANNFNENATQNVLYTIDDRGDAKILNEGKTIITNYYDNVDLTTTRRTTTTAITKIKLIMNASEDTKITNTKSANNYVNNNKTSTIQYLKQTITSTLKPIIENTTTTDLSLVNLTRSSSILIPTLRPDLKTTTAATVSTISTQRLKDQQKYFINTSHCHIPYVDPFSPDIRNMFKPENKTGCYRDQAIISVTFNENASQYFLHINYTVAKILRKEKNPPIEEDLLCCYHEIVRSGSGSNVDTSFKLLPCTNFHQNFTVPLHINGITVQCKSKHKNTILQEDAFSFIQVNKTAIQKEASQNKSSANDHRKLSILMIGIDSLSRINFRRNMPKTFKYLMDNKWYELMGYNKVGDNTLPNLMPLLSGYTRPTVYEKCKPQQNVGGFDSCNFIWTTFKKNGYYTAYAEDSPAISTFNYRLKGFQKPPTDHYFRPFAMAIEKSLKKTTKSRLTYCIGRRQFGEYVYDYATEFVKRYQNHTSFGFFWTNSFSHNSYDIAATMDSNMVHYFQTWEKLGVFDNSVVIFFSDHGVRWGPLLNLSEGFLEERLPMFFMSVPKWFKMEYSNLVKSLEINQYRLVTPFDIHMTLQHLLKLAKPGYSIQQTYDCKKCQTIFKEMPENRTCDDAGIPEAWCTCIPFKTESTKNTQIKVVAHLIIKEMNHYLEMKNLTNLCSPLKLKEITLAKKRYPNELTTVNNVTTYAIDFITDPLTEPKTLFSAIVDFNKNNKSIHLNVEDISRKSLYGKIAECTDDKQFKKYCICKNSLKL